MEKISSFMDHIYNYDNFRQFLKDYFNEGKKISQRFSKRYFARKAGFLSHSFIIQVINGEKNLSLDSIKKVSSALELVGDKRKYFINLVLYNQAKNIEDKEKYFNILKELRQSILFYELKNSKEFILFHKWYYAIVREVASVLNTKDPKVIVEHIEPKISKDDAKEALDALFDAQFLIEDNGNIVENHPYLSASKLSPLIYNNQKKEFIFKSVDAMDKFDASKRHVSYATCTIAVEDYKKVEEMIDSFRRKILSLSSDNKHKPQKVMQLNIQFFPLSKQLSPSGRIK